MSLGCNLQRRAGRCESDDVGDVVGGAANSPTSDCLSKGLELFAQRQLESISNRACL